MSDTSRTARGQSAERPASVGRLVLLLVAGVLFGVLLASVRGDGTGIRYDIGNVGAIWLALPALAGLMTRSGRAAAFLAFVITFIALVAFYATGDKLSITPWPHALAARLFFIVSGPVIGAIMAVLTGMAHRRNARLRLVPLAVAFVAEPAFSVLRIQSRSYSSVLYAVELVVGIGLASTSLLTPPGWPVSGRVR